MRKKLKFHPTKQSNKQKNDETTWRKTVALQGAQTKDFWNENSSSSGVIASDSDIYY